MSQSPQSLIEPMLLRTTALATVAGTIGFLFLLGDWRISNAFLVPDLLVSMLLVAGAFLPSRAMRVVLLAGFATGVGVFSAAAAGYLVAGRFGIGAMTALVTCVAAGAWLLRVLLKNISR